MSTGHYEKPNIIQCHPQASDLLASAGYDFKIFIWNLANQSVAITLESIPEPVCPGLLSYMLLREGEMEEVCFCRNKNVASKTHVPYLCLAAKITSLVVDFFFSINDALVKASDTSKIW